MKILAVGDVSGESGVEFFESHIGTIKREYAPDIVVVNGENCCRVGINPKSADRLFDAGADVITLGNHSFDDRSILTYLDDNPRIIRPANLPPPTPGFGYHTFMHDQLRICVINLIGRALMNNLAACPFYTADAIIEKENADIYIVDFHAETTSEKKAMAYFLSDKVSVLYGTHTHVQTSDNQVMPGGCGYITDLGMTGGTHSVLGLDPEQCVAHFRGEIISKAKVCSDGMRLQGAVFTLDNHNRCSSVTRIDYAQGDLKKDR